MKVIVIGGGIGGQALAAALALRGMEATVYEQSPVIRECGASLTMWPNGMKALSRLRLAHTVRAVGWPILAADVRRTNGDVLSTAPVSRVSAHAGAATIALRRADLQRLLWQAAGVANTRFGKRCAGVEQDADSVRAVMDDGEVAQGDVLIGADGLWSRVRELLVGPAAPKALQCLWRGIVPLHDASLLSGRSFETWGVGTRFGMVQINRSEAYWFAGADSWPDEPFETARWRLLAEFGHWHDPIRRALELTPASDAMRTVIYDRPPLATWTFGRIALLGDAAHPMTPDLGQGACTALEDAIEVAACLAETPEVEVALQRYVERRRRRCTRLAVHSRRMGAISQWSSGALCRLRNLATRLTPTAVVSRGLLGIVDPSRGRLARSAGRVTSGS